MTRLKVVCCTFLVISLALTSLSGKEASLSSEIVYVREDIPIIPTKPCKGKFYEDLVPDTFDIAERAKLGINVLTGATNPTADHELQRLPCSSLSGCLPAGKQAGETPVERGALRRPRPRPGSRRGP